MHPPPGAVAGRDRLSGQAGKSWALGMPWCQPPALPRLPAPRKGRQNMVLPGLPGRQGHPSSGSGTASASPVPQEGVLCPPGVCQPGDGPESTTTIPP